jgi:polyphenol oxidase
VTVSIEILTPEWPAPKTVRAAFTLRGGGVSMAPYNSLNLGMRVGDDPSAVAENRRLVHLALGLPEEPIWLEQVHGTQVCDLDARCGSAAPAQADAVVSRRAGQVCAVQVADCLPVLLSARDGSSVAAVHAGWRGLLAGVLETTVAKLGADPGSLLSWLGPVIGPAHFEVGEEVRNAFIARDGGAAAHFSSNSRGRWQCDLAGLARRRLLDQGVTAVFGGGWCTHSDSQHFFSHRRDGVCGRMAAVIWIG